MFLVLIKHDVPEGNVAWAVHGAPFEHKVDAIKYVKLRAETASNTFAVVKVEDMFRRSISVTEVEIAP